MAVESAENDTVVPNERLRYYMDKAGLSPAALSERTGFEIKTIERWLAGKNTPHAGNARIAAEPLGCEISDLWPDKFPLLDPPSSGTVAVSVYANRADVPRHVWIELFTQAREHIDFLVYGGTFLFDGIPRFTQILTAAADRGVAIRFAVGDPESTAVAQRGDEELIGTSLAGRCRMTLSRLEPLAGTSGIDIRTHRTPLYTSMFRADDRLVANPHLYGAPASDNPALYIDRGTAPDIWDDHRRAFEKVWRTARAI
ncbi:XRE family transcriptional regulator [Antrihabitans cavernicola]|uniref:XRE family transcriptional regulator n=1 Tax=Antrihabitans cavernicola TaxID=2495913 RepID=A0A5A7S1C2_9NOCA|nr:XRE family transcriptional regulator [Spelaeibacter cavernicola]KAA0016071.1 XRE family transcriptional regulator [Spelaeibacter cavernicola]